MQEVELELAVGDTFQIGNACYTVVDVDGGEVCFRIDAVDDLLCLAASPPAK